jgi:hypothetical protein
MTEVEARAALRAFDGVGGVEYWIAGQTWQAAPDGWIVTGDLGGWRFRPRPMADGVRVSATVPGGGRRPQPSRKKRPSLVQERPSLESRDKPLM